MPSENSSSNLHLHPQTISFKQTFGRILITAVLILLVAKSGTIRETPWADQPYTWSESGLDSFIVWRRVSVEEFKIPVG